MKIKILLVIPVFLISFLSQASDDCYYGFKSSSASQSCNLNSAHFEPGSSSYCRINADCHWYSVGSGHQYETNNSTWYVGDVHRLINNNGRLEVGNYTRNIDSPNDAHEDNNSTNSALIE